MMSKTGDTHIRISREHYKRLKQRKREEESFDDVLGRLLEDDRDLLAGFGAWERTDRRAAVEDVHEEMNREMEETVDEIARRRSDDDR